jgi:membrane fusion protein (multidrug efflux system)
LPDRPPSPGAPSTGTIASISSRIDPVTRAIVVRAILPNPERLLKPGLLMQVELLKNPRDVLVIPEEALIPSGRDNHVWSWTDPPNPPSPGVAR